VRSALPVPLVVLAVVTVQQRCVGDGEVPVDPLGGEPAVQVLAGKDVRLDGLVRVGASVPIVRGPEVVLELGEGRLPVGKRGDLEAGPVLAGCVRVPNAGVVIRYGQRTLEGPRGETAAG